VRTHSSRSKVPIADVVGMAQAVLIGFMLGELWFLTKIIGSKINAYVQSSNSQGVALAASNHLS